MEAIGHLAAGVAHDFYSPLMVGRGGRREQSRCHNIRHGRRSTARFITICWLGAIDNRNSSPI
jgi:hypothetical protein